MKNKTTTFQISCSEKFIEVMTLQSKKMPGCPRPKKGSGSHAFKYFAKLGLKEVAKLDPNFVDNL